MTKARNKSNSVTLSEATQQLLITEGSHFILSANYEQTVQAQTTKNERSKGNKTQENNYTPAHKRNVQCCGVVLSVKASCNKTSSLCAQIRQTTACSSAAQHEQKGVQYIQKLRKFTLQHRKFGADAIQPCGNIRPLVPRSTAIQAMVNRTLLRNRVVRPADISSH